MGEIKVTTFDIEGLYVIEPKIFGDERGYFVETYNKKDFEEKGLCMNFVQDNQSFSTKGVLRGLHYQKHFPQGKLVRVVSGEVFDVAVDIREGSKTYGQWHGEVLSGDNMKSFYVPEGFAHGFYVMSDTAVFSYKCTDFYHPNDEAGLPWNDETIGVKWPVDGMEPILSDKDTKHKPFMKRIMITGASGQLGRAVYAKLKDRVDCTIFRTTLDPEEGFLVLDAANEEQVVKLVQELKVDVIIHCAAMTAVDLCETEKEMAYVNNVVASANVAKAAELVGAKLFHISTDYVFDGEKIGAYVETDKPAPVSEYGRTKYLAEQEVQKYCSRVFILRTSWLYGEGNNFVKTMLRLSKDRPKISVVDDQKGNPTSCKEVAKVISFLLNKDDYGIYHTTCEGETTWYDFTKEIFKVWGKETKVIPISSEEFNAKAKRPHNSSLENTGLKKLNYQMSRWEDALVEYYKDNSWK